MNLYVAGATLGAASAAAVGAVMIFSISGTLSGTGSATADQGPPVDIATVPYSARITYENGAALIPISVALRARSETAGRKLCENFGAASQAVSSTMRREIKPTYAWRTVARSGLDRRIRDNVNAQLGGDLIVSVALAPGDVPIGENPVTCSQLKRWWRSKLRKAGL